MQIATWIVKRMLETSYPLRDVISEVHLSESGEVDLIAIDGATVVHLGNRDYGRRITALASFLARTPKREGIAAYNYIDLRVENQVIVRERGLSKRG